jgi:hypothetical protein
MMKKKLSIDYIADYIHYGRTNGLRALELVIEELKDPEQIHYAEEAKMELQGRLVKKEYSEQWKKQRKGKGSKQSYIE